MALFRNALDEARKLYEQMRANVGSWKQMATSPQMRQEYVSRVVKPTVDRYWVLSPQSLGQAKQSAQYFINRPEKASKWAGQAASNMLSVGQRGFEQLGESAQAFRNKQYLQGATRALFGGAKTILPVSPLYHAANIISSSPTPIGSKKFISPSPLFPSPNRDEARRFSAGLLKGISGMPSVAPNVPQQNINIGPLRVDPLMTAGNMIGFVKNPAWRAIFPATSQLLKVSPFTSKVTNFVLQRLTKGGLEGYIQALDEMPTNISGQEKLKLMAQYIGFGAGSEIAFDAGAAALRKAGQAIPLDKLSEPVKKQMLKVMDTVADEWRKANRKYTFREGGKLVTMPEWKYRLGWKGGKLQSTLGKLPKEPSPQPPSGKLIPIKQQVDMLTKMRSGTGRFQPGEVYTQVGKQANKVIVQGADEQGNILGNYIHRGILSPATFKPSELKPYNLTDEAKNFVLKDFGISPTTKGAGGATIKIKAPEAPKTVVRLGRKSVISPKTASPLRVQGPTTKAQGTPIGKAVSQTTTASGQGSIPPSSSSGSIISDKDLVSQMASSIKGAKKLRGLQEQVYSKELGQKYARLVSIGKKATGEQGLYARKGALKGELTKVDYESIRQNFTQENVDRLFGMVWKNKNLSEWDKVTAGQALGNILGRKGGRVPTRNEIALLDQVFGKEFTEALLSKRSLWQKLGEAGMQAYNLPRSMMTGIGDFSGTLLQNILFAYRHPLMTAKNFGKQLRMFASEDYFKASQDEIASRPTRELMRRADLQLTDVGGVMSKREEQFMASWAEQIPGLGRLVRATGRAWTGFLNRMRADVFDQMVNSYRNVGGDVKDPNFLKSLGDFVNAGTGRGSLGKLEGSASLLSQGLFSARKLAASAQMINPVWYAKAHPTVRKEALKTMLAFVGGGMLITQLAKLAGAEVGDDPTSADFGKIKIGNTRLNVWGTYQQVAVLLARLYKGYATSSTTGRITTLGEGYKPLTRLDLISRFFESKEHPTLSLIFGALRGQNQVGQPFNVPSEVLSRFIPMILSDSYDLYQEHGSVGLLGAIPAILGIPTQTYGKTEIISGETKLGQPSTQVRQLPNIAESISEKVFGRQPIGSSNLGNIQSYVDQLDKMPPQEAATIFDQIKKTNIELAKKIVEVKKERKLGITPQDVMLQDKGVTSGDRAIAIKKQLDKLKTDQERAALWDEYVKKKIITKEVAKQLKEML